MEAPKSKETAPTKSNVSVIERRWAQVKSIASGFAEIKPWISQGDAVVTLILDHEMGYFKAIDARDAELAAAYKILLESDLVAYRYVAWHVFVYQNLLRLRSRIDSLISSFDADKRDFTDRKPTEEAVRALKSLIASVGKDSAKNQAMLVTNHPFHFRASSSNEVVITVTSASDKNKRATLEKETASIKNIQLQVQVIIDHTNKFLRNAMKEGFWQAVEAAKEYYEVRQGILDSDEGPESEKSDKPTGGGGGDVAEKAEKETAEAAKKAECYEKYKAWTAYCGETYTDDKLYETCMDNAWKNYIRCLNGLPPKPLVPVK
jgi:hypothetical protein